MNISTKIGLGSGLLVTGGNLLHTEYEVVKENCLETLVACVIITGICVGAAKLGGYIADNTIGRYIPKYKHK